MPRRLSRYVLLLAAVLAFGTLGYRLVEGAPLWDCFYMTVITLTTVGYHEVFPLSLAGEAFTVVLLAVGIGLLLTAATELARSIVEGELRSVLGSSRRSRMLERLQDHEVVCGWGRMGQAVVAELVRARRQVVTVERHPDRIRELEAAGLLHVAGDATEERTLRAAGVHRARGLVACLDDDAHNVYTVLTARSLNPNLFIVARATEEGAEGRMLRAGADRVMNPYRLGGLRLAHMLAKPGVVDFLDFSLQPSSGEHLLLEQLSVTENSPLAGKSLAELDLRKRHRVAVVSLHRGSTLIPNPDPALRLQVGDLLVVLGNRHDLDRFETGTGGTPT
ncbi:MAG: potassium channel protein [Thermoanaerobaculaceae bacterium]|nr:potassium channel protein [Thermoanaerobaculaceae bacterium]